MLGHLFHAVDPDSNPGTSHGLSRVPSGVILDLGSKINNKKVKYVKFYLNCDHSRRVSWI